MKPARRRLWAAGALAAAVLVSVPSAGGWQSPPAMKVIGYYADWTAARYPLAGIPAAKLTHVNYAFAKIGPDNRLTWNASAASEQVYPGDCSEPSCRHGLFNQITLVKRRHQMLSRLESRRIKSELLGQRIELIARHVRKLPRRRRGRRDCGYRRRCARQHLDFTAGGIAGHALDEFPFSLVLESLCTSPPDRKSHDAHAK